MGFGCSNLHLPKRRGLFMGSAFPQPNMTLEIALTLAVIALTLVALIREWAAPDVLAL